MQFVHKGTALGNNARWLTFLIQGDQKENKSEQALQIIGHVVAEFYAWA
jgi:hypothetical protein